MLDFLKISTRTTKKGVMEIYPKFIVGKSSDLMIRGGDFYAVWVEERGLWSTDEADVLRLIDNELDKYRSENCKNVEDHVIVLHMWDSDSGSIDKWHKYCQKQCRDSFVMLDEKLIFSNMKIEKKDYASKKLNYPLEKGDCPSYEKLISTLYSEEERAKIEWAIGSIITGDSKTIQKFMVLYGAAGTGKSTILNIIQMLFEGYYSVFDAKALGSSSNSFALEAFKCNPLIAIQHDGDLSKIEDNTRLNSLVSHELMTVNEKFKSTYANNFKCFLFMGTNKPVKITDGKSGLIRRLIDVTPSGNKLSAKEYDECMKHIKFELGAIAYHCKEVFLENPNRYDNYIPLEMMGASNDFYNFVIDSFSVFKKEDGTTLKTAWERYKQYCEEAKVPYPYSQRKFKEELKNYFREFRDSISDEDEDKIRFIYKGFKSDIFFESDKKKEKENETKDSALMQFDSTESIFDLECATCPAQYATAKDIPSKKWDNVTSTLSDIDTSKTHYVKVPENHIVIDFDIKDENGNKSLEKNIEAASKWPKTYAELSKSGSGVHLHYIYTGDASKLSRVYDDNIEIKVNTGNSALRRKLTKCNNLPIATISSGLPLKGEKMINKDVVQTEKGLRTTIKKCLDKEIHPGTKPNIDFIYKILDDAYSGGLHYDVSDMKNDIYAFAANSTNQSDYCIKLVSKMKFKSEEASLPISSDTELVFYDVEVFPNLFLVNWKVAGEGNPVVRMINPSPEAIEDLMKCNLVGFNCRRYDNHILYARLIGYTNKELYDLSMKIINGEPNCFFSEAYNVSYTDVYDFASKKQSLKKWEIELGIHHQELGLPWDQPVPEEMWTKVAEYCDNDVLATEAVFNARKADFVARQIQVDLVKILHGTTATVNDTTNTLSTKIIFGSNRKPQSVFNYRDMSKPVGSDRYEEYREKFGKDYVFRVFDEEGLPLYRDYIPGETLPEGYSILPFFKGYKFECGKSTYLGEDIGEGGRVYSEPGMHVNVWDGDIASQHPHSAIFECVFGPEYTKRFEDIVNARVAIKHHDFDVAGTLLEGALKPYLNEEQAADLAQALKIVINSIYGLTSASFENPFRDPRNIDNIVAKRGALFMTLLKREVQKLGYTVAHIKTDSIKIPDADKKIQEFIVKFGKEYGYTFETEAIFEKFCLVNDAVYIAKYKEPLIDKKTKKEIWWTATGKQFAVPYVFKTLFSKDPIEFDDMCETIAVSKGDLYLDMNESLTDVSGYEKEYENLTKKLCKVDVKGTERDSIAKRVDELKPLIETGHSYKFVGRVGRFCPIKPGCDGGVLYRVNDGKYYAAAGTKGYRWLESEMVKEFGKDNDIDKSFYTKLVNDAVDTISEYGDFEWFTSDEPVPEVEEKTINELPWKMSCGKDSCSDCPNFVNDQFNMECKLGYDISDLIAMNEDSTPFDIR